MRKNRPIIILTLSVILAVIFLYIFKIGNTLELKLLDWRFVLRGPRPLTEDVFIVAMGDESVSPETLGRWPWRRAYMASFVNMMMPYSPYSLIFDILFTEPSEDFPGDDQLLAEQADLMNKVYFPFFCIPEEAKEARGYRDEVLPAAKELLEQISLGNAEEFARDSFVEARKVVMPIPLFSRSAAGSGYVNAIPDSDGVTRRVPLVMRYKDYIVPNVAFYAALKYMGVPNDHVKIRPGRYVMIDTGSKKIRIPVDDRCQMLVNHPGKFRPENIPMISFVNVIGSHDAILSGGEPIFDLRRLRSRIVFLGLTATGTSDLRPTPYEPLFPMVGLLATVSSNVISGSFLKPAPVAVDLMLIILAALIASLITVKFRPVLSAVLNIIFAGLLFLLSYLLFKGDYVLVTLYPFLAVIFTYTAITIYRFTGEEKEKKVIRGIFQRYVSSQVVDTLLTHPEEIRLGGERRRLTVFFSDIRGFTTMSENMEPEEVVSILNEYLTEMIDIIFKYYGTLDKFIGDAVMAVWGAPSRQENHAELAVRAAWAMKIKIDEMREKWDREGKKKIGVGMGINTGDVVVGNMGSDQFSDYTVIGDNVNLAARLEENAGPGQLIISETTYKEVRHIVKAERLKPLKVKGKEKPVEVYEIKGVS